MSLIKGIHHVTAIAGSSKKNLDFYAGILGLRLVKKTVNFDAPEVYHLYYSDESGTPGTVITFFPYEGLISGRQGKGMLNTTGFSVPLSALDFWINRLSRFNIAHKEPFERFPGEVVVYLEDTDGLGLELVFNEADDRSAPGTGIVPPEQAIKGFYHVELWEEGYERTAGLLTEQLDHRLIAEKGNRFRFAVEDKPGKYIDLLCSPDSLKGLAGAGTVHHLAFATADRASQELVRERIVQRNLNPTPILDRNYFTSIYFREPGGVLFEIATEVPGFFTDEDASSAGEQLMLPSWFEKDRERLQKILQPVELNREAFTTVSES